MLNTQIIRDLNNGFVYYPSSGTDFGVMKAIVNYYDGSYPTFIYCDSGRPITEVLRFYYNTAPLNFIDNKLGLAGFEIVSTMEYSCFSDFVNIKSDLERLVKLFGPYYNDYISTLFDQRVVRYELRLNKTTVVLYFIRYEAVAVLNWLLGLIKDKNIHSGFVLSQPGYGWTESKYEDALIKIYENANILPDFLLTEGYWWAASYQWKAELKTESKILTLKVPFNNN